MLYLIFGFKKKQNGQTGNMFAPVWRQSKCENDSSHDLTDETFCKIRTGKEMRWNNDSGVTRRDDWINYRREQQQPLLAPALVWLHYFDISISHIGKFLPAPVNMWWCAHHVP